MSETRYPFQEGVIALLDKYLPNATGLQKYRIAEGFHIQLQKYNWFSSQPFIYLTSTDLKAIMEYYGIDAATASEAASTLYPLLSNQSTDSIVVIDLDSNGRIVAIIIIIVDD